MAETENEKRYVYPITKENKQKIVDSSVQNLPERPTINATDMKKIFVRPIVNGDGQPYHSIADEVDRVASEADGAIASLNEEMPLVLTTTLELTANSYNDLVQREADGHEVADDGFPKSWFNKEPKVGDTFLAVAVSKDNRSVSMTCKVRHIDDKNNLYYSVEDLVLIGEDVPMLLTTQRFDGITLKVFTKTEGGKYTFTGYEGHHSIGVAQFNITPRIGNQFFGTVVLMNNNSKDYKSIATFTAQVTGIENNKVNYTLIDATVFHDGDLDKTVDILQNRMGVAESDISELKMEQGETQTKLDNLAGDVSSNNKQITALQNRLDTFSLYEIVDSLPTTDIDANKLYLVPATSTEDGNILEEWLWAGNKWELVGTKKVDIDLTPYAKKDDVIAKTDRGKENGVATLDGNKKIPKAQLPDDLIFGENGLPEEWKLIGETTVTPDADGGLPQGVYFSLNSDGNPFKLKRAKVIVLTDTTKSDYVYPTSTASVQIKGIFTNGGIGWHRATWVSGFPIIANKYAKIVFDVEAIDSIAYATGVADNTLDGHTIGEFSGSRAVYGGLGVPLSTEWLEEIGVSVGSGYLTKGTQVLLYGIPADATSGGGSGGSSLPEGFNPDDYVKNDEFDDKFKQSATDTKTQWNETEKSYARAKIGAVSETYVDENKGTKLYLHRITHDKQGDDHEYEITFIAPTDRKYIANAELGDESSTALIWKPDHSKCFNMRYAVDGEERLILHVRNTYGPVPSFQDGNIPLAELLVPSYGGDLEFITIVPIFTSFDDDRYTVNPIEFEEEEIE